MALFGSGLFAIMFVMVFAIIICGFIYVIVSGVGQWNRNNHSPQLVVEAQVVTKRTSVTHHSDMNNAAMSHTSTSYFVTFQVESGDRMEFLVSGNEYGMLAEGDLGRLTFQGTRYLGFVRRI